MPNPELFHISVLAANASDVLLEKQVRISPEIAVPSDEAAAARPRAGYAGPTKILGGRQAFIEAAVSLSCRGYRCGTSMMGFAGL